MRLDLRLSRLACGVLVSASCLVASAPSFAFPTPLGSGVPSGQTWVVCQGYNGSISHGGYNQYGLDLTANLGGVGSRGCIGDVNATSGRQVRAPGTGTIAWNDGDALCVNFDAGDSMVLAHTTGPGRGARVGGGAVIGTVKPAGTGRNGGYAHLHIAAYRGANCQGANRTPFTGAARLAGAPDMPASGSLNQWAGTRIAGSASTPPPPPPPPPGANSALVDEPALYGPQQYYTRFTGLGWEGDMIRTYAEGAGRAVVNAWEWVTPVALSAGRYRVEAFIPRSHGTAVVRYYVRHNGGQTAVDIDQNPLYDVWANLGEYAFSSGRASVGSNDSTGIRGREIGIDAIKWTRVG